MFPKKVSQAKGGTEESKNISFTDDERFFRLLFENHPIPMFIYEMESLAFLEINNAMLEKLGYSRDELGGITLKNLMPVNEKNHTSGELKKELLPLQHPSTWNIQLKDGSVRSMEVTSHTLMHNGRKGLLALAQDAAKEKEQLAATEAELRALFASMRDVVLVIDRDGVYRKIAPTNPGLLFLPPQKLLGKNLKDIFSTEQAEIFLAAICQVLETRQSLRIEYSLMIRDRLLEFSASITPMEADSTLWVARDVTERKKADAALRESEERYHTLFDRMMDGIYRSTHEGRFVDVNPAMVKMFGYSSKEEMLAVDIKKDLYFAPEERGSHILDTGQEEVEEYRMRRKDGSEIWVEDHGYYVHDEQGRPKYHEGMLRDITTRKQVKGILLKLRKAVDTSTEAIFMTDTEGIFTYVNPRFTALYGFSADEIVGKATPRILKSSLLSKQEYVEFWKKITSKQEVKGEVINKTKDGKLINIDRSATPILDDADHIIGYLSIQRDVTERKMAEDALRSAEANFRSIFENATVGIYQSTPDGRFLNVNKIMAHIFGYASPQEMLDGVTSIEKQYYVDPASRQEFTRLMTEHGYVHEFNSVNYRKDGSHFHIQESARAVKDERGNILYYEGFVSDITERKKSEESLRESEARFRHMADATPVMVWMSDKDGSSNYFNKTWLDFTGRTMEQELGIGWKQGIHPDDYERCVDIFTNAFNERREFKMEYRLRNTKGEYHWLFDHGVPRFSVEGEFFGFIGSCMDISDFKQAEAELNRANASLIIAHRELEQSLQHEQTLSRTDGLTGLYNYRHFFELASREFGASIRYQRPLSIIIFDTDHLKEVNDTLGHMAGDKMLTTVARTASEQVRSVDSLARYGGDEFVILLPQTNAQMAYAIAERIRMSVEALSIPTEKGPLSVTLSIGIAEMQADPADESVEQVVQRADKALYAAKQGGRNRSHINFGK